MSFIKELKEIEDTLLDALGNLVIETGVEIITTLTSKPPIGTPIKTGWARSNWLYDYKVSTKRPIATNTSVPTALSAQYKSIERLINRNLRDYSSYYIYNNVPYIIKLNSGTISKQSPPMFIEKAVQRGVKNVSLKYKRAKRILRQGT